MASRPTAPVVRSSAIPADTCGQQAAQRLVGSVFTPQSRTALSKAVGHDRIRVIRPGSVITQDLRTDRLNLIVDESGRLLTARCG
ncbi:MAG: I78 family peptidase inhibitor [Novosphingobium sp.]